jgi:hypothetical protein
VVVESRTKLAMIPHAFVLVKLVKHDLL